MGGWGSNSEYGSPGERPCAGGREVGGASFATMGEMVDVGTARVVRRVLKQYDRMDMLVGVGGCTVHVAAGLVGIALEWFTETSARMVGTQIIVCNNKADFRPWSAAA